MIKHIFTLALISLSLSGCGLYSKYERPADIEITDNLFDYIEANQDSSDNFASLSWRELFTDPQLQSLIEDGLQNNTDLNVARLNVEIVTAALKSARLSFLPSLNASAQGSISHYSASTNKTYDIAAEASWEIDLFGKLRNAKEQSKAALEQSRAYEQGVQTEIIATIANSYYNLLMLDEKLSISHRTKDNWDANIKVMEALKRAGRINETSVLQSKANSVSLQSSIVTIEQQIAELENTLSALLAIPTKSIPRGKIDDISFPSNISIGVPIELLSNRPDIRVAESTLAEAFYATNEARSSMYPSITLSGSAGFTNNLGAIVNPGEMLYNAVASALQPIFNRGALRAELKISKAEQEQAMLNFKQAIIDAGTEVNNALSLWQSSNERLAYGKVELDLLERTVNQTELLMRHGSANYLEVLVAQLSLLQTELSYSDDKFNQIQGVISLYRSLGGGAN